MANQNQLAVTEAPTSSARAMLSVNAAEGTRSARSMRAKYELDTLVTRARNDRGLPSCRRASLISRPRRFLARSGVSFSGFDRDRAID